MRILKFARRNFARMILGAIVVGLFFLVIEMMIAWKMFGVEEAYPIEVVLLSLIAAVVGIVVVAWYLYESDSRNALENDLFSEARSEIELWMSAAKRVGIPTTLRKAAAAKKALRHVAYEYHMLNRDSVPEEASRQLKVNTIEARVAAAVIYFREETRILEEVAETTGMNENVIDELPETSILSSVIGCVPTQKSSLPSGEGVLPIRRIGSDDV